jgi:hypothetical protein
MFSHGLYEAAPILPAGRATKCEILIWGQFPDD